MMRKYDIKNSIVISQPTSENGRNGYFEVPYIEYRNDGTVLNIGSEDFSSQRLKTLKRYEIVEKTDEKTKSSAIYIGGRNRWKHLSYIVVNSRKDAIKIASFEYPNKELQFRKV